jgi:hypothetical protein
VLMAGASKSTAKAVRIALSLFRIVDGPANP